jgi:Carboxypeptidase regulatory-like domain/TonB dependent receptor
MIIGPLLLLFLAQSSQAQLTGEVLDPSSKAVVQASISLVDLERNATSRVVSGPDGRYLFDAVRPGHYSVIVEASGFQKIIRSGITLTTGERIGLDFKLTIGSVEESLTITSDAPLLRTESADLGQVVDNGRILELPLNGRSFISMAGLAPGVALPPGSAFPRINGGRPRTNEYLFDGVTVLQPEPGQVTFMPVVDAIQEFKIETNSPPAEFGRFNGGVVNLTTKSGTNQLHGTAFEFLRNEALNARNLFAPATPSNPAKPLFRRNQFGFVLGGPIAHDKTFFFVDYQGSAQAIARVRTSTVPTLLQRQGIFTETVAGFVPKIIDPSTHQPFPAGVIPPDRMDQSAVSLLSHYPLPTAGGTANNYRRIGNETDNQQQWDTRLDHRFGAMNSLFLRYSFAHDISDPVTPLPDGSGNLTSGVLGRTHTLGQSFASSYLHVFNSSLTNELRLGYSRRTVDRTALDLPTLIVDGYQQLGPSPNAYSNSKTDITHLIDTISLSKGAHFIKAGLDFRWERMGILQPPSPKGLFHFSAPETGFSLASFLLGQVDRFSEDIQRKLIRPRAHIQEYFLQDDWKASRRLSVNAGVRYTLNFPSTEADDQGAVFDLATQKLRYLGQNGFPHSARTLHKFNLGPRLGLAYRPSNDTVIRSGYGLIWIEQAGITTPFTTPQFPFLQTVTQRSLDNVTPAFVLSSGPSVSAIPPTADAGLGQGVFTVDGKLGSGYAQQWNLSIQHELSANTLIELGYAGSKITHLGIPDTSINQLTADQLHLGPALLERVPNPFFGIIDRSSSLGDPTITRAQLLKPFPEFTTVSFFRNNVGNSNYHAFQAKLEKRFSHGLAILASYTHSKLIDEASSVFDASILTGPVADFPVAESFNRRLERDVSAGDIPNVFVTSVTYDVPARGALLGGWALTGILTLESGMPLPVTQNTNFNAFGGFGTQRPNRLHNPNLAKEERTTTRYFDTAAFAIAPQFTIGNTSRNPVRGPGFRNLDLALIKRAKFKERYTAELRAEVFNVTNTPPLGSPNTVLASPGFGSITSAGDPRVVQVAAKIHF